NRRHTHGVLESRPHSSGGGATKHSLVLGVLAHFVAGSTSRNPQLPLTGKDDAQRAVNVPRTDVLLPGLAVAQRQESPPPRPAAEGYARHRGGVPLEGGPQLGLSEINKRQRERNGIDLCQGSLNNSLLLVVGHLQEAF